MASFLGKFFGDSPKAAATPKAFTVQVDPLKFGLSTTPDGPVHIELESLKQKLTKLSSNVENNLMLSIRAATKKNLGTCRFSVQV